MGNLQDAFLGVGKGAFCFVGPLSLMVCAAYSQKFPVAEYFLAKAVSKMHCESSPECCQRVSCTLATNWDHKKCAQEINHAKILQKPWRAEGGGSPGGRG